MRITTVVFVVAAVWLVLVLSASDALGSSISSSHQKQQQKQQQQQQQQLQKQLQKQQQQQHSSSKIANNINNHHQIQVKQDGATSLVDASSSLSGLIDTYFSSSSFEWLPSWSSISIKQFSTIVISFEIYEEELSVVGADGGSDELFFQQLSRAIAKRMMYFSLSAVFLVTLLLLVAIFAWKKLWSTMSTRYSDVKLTDEREMVKDV